MGIKARSLGMDLLPRVRPTTQSASSPRDKSSTISFCFSFRVSLCLFGVLFCCVFVLLLFKKKEKKKKWAQDFRSNCPRRNEIRIPKRHFHTQVLHTFQQHPATGKVSSSNHPAEGFNAGIRTERTMAESIKEGD